MCALIALAVPTAAHAVTFGADLNSLPANDAQAGFCSNPPPGLFYPANSPSCMWSYQGTGANTLVAPASGVVNTVRVKVGTTTGKMRVNVIRFLFRQTGDAAHPFSAGPFLEAYGPEFTPTANAVTTVPVNLSMKEDSTPALTDLSTIQVIDALALEVEAPNVPVPLFSAPGALSYGIYPGPTSQALTAPSPNGLPSTLTLGLGVLMSADLTPDPGAPAPTPGAPAPTPTLPAPTGVPAVRLPKGTVPVKRGVATLPIACQVADCSGLVTLLRGAGGAAAAKKQPATLGSTKFTAKAGTTARVKVKLNRAGKALLKKHRSVKVKARVTFTSGGGKPATATITLKR
jgi:hypothetical protein